MKDFQMQVNFERDKVPIEHQSSQAIKSENITPTIPMPNIPDSVGQTSSKKRKRSSSRSATATTQRDSGTTDPAILNSEVYKVYCQNVDPKEAMEKIKNMKTCLSLREPTLPFPKKDIWKKSCEKFLKQLWSYENAGKSKWEQIQAFLSGDINRWDLFDEELPVTIDGEIQEYYFWDIIDSSFTVIEILLPNGIEFWYVENFESGVGVSKWYRAVNGDASSYYCDEFGDKIAVLKMLGLEASTIEKYHYEFLKKKPVEKNWLEFADTVAQHVPSNLIQDSEKCGYHFIQYDVQESKTSETMVVNVALQIGETNYNNGSKRIIKSYHGNSTRPLKKRRPNNEKEEMKNEAKKAALMECFKDRFGITEFSDIYVDELDRPQTA